jgi:hypothetical protein
MKLIKLTRELNTGRKGVPSVYLLKSGSVVLSKELVKEAKLKAGDLVLFQGEENEEGKVDSWFLAKDPEGFELRENKTGSLTFNSSGFVQQFFKLSLGSRTRIATLAVNPESLWINTVKPIKHEFERPNV